MSRLATLVVALIALTSSISSVSTHRTTAAAAVVKASPRDHEAVAGSSDGKLSGSVSGGGDDALPKLEAVPNLRASVPVPDVGAYMSKPPQQKEKEKADGAPSTPPRRYPFLSDPSKLNINSSTLTISGISAGSAMAVQFQIAFSAIVKAVGTIAGIPYMCAQYNGAMGAINCMSYPYQIDSSVLLTYISSFYALGTIDPPSNIKNHMTMVFSGIEDSVVKQGTVRIIDQMYAAMGVPPTQRYQTYNISAEHSWVTNDYGEACAYLGTPYINNCDYDFGGIFLNKAFEFLKQAPLKYKGAYNPNNLFKISQETYGASAVISMDTVAFVYVPTACQSGAVQCHLHVNFHGCNQQRTVFPEDEARYVGHTGLNKWAETNNIVILYPQAIASDVIPYNPQGCFDWWGYTNAAYTQQVGLQMAVIRGMIRGLAGF